MIDGKWIGEKLALNSGSVLPFAVKLGSKSSINCNRSDKKHGYRLTLMGILVKMLDSSGVEGGGATNDTVDLVTLLDQELSEVRSILASDT